LKDVKMSALKILQIGDQQFNAGSFIIKDRR